MVVPIRRQVAFILGVLGVLGLWGCGTGGDATADRTQSEPEEMQLEILISTADGRIGEISDLVLSGEGHVFAVDRQASQVHVVDASGDVGRSIGRQGAGPGEFAQPVTLQVRGDSLLVVDWRNARVQALTLSGDYLSTRPLPPGQAPSIGGSGRLVRPTWGAGASLAVIHTADLTEVAGIGSIAGEPTNRVNPREMKEEIGQGRVPNIFLNTAQAVVDNDGAAWLYVPARGTIQKFDSLGTELWSLQLSEPEAESLREEFVTENGVRPGASFYPLRFILDATMVGEDVWLLLGHSMTGQAAVRIGLPAGVDRRSEVE